MGCVCSSVKRRRRTQSKAFHSSSYPQSKKSKVDNSLDIRMSDIVVLRPGEYIGERSELSNANLSDFCNSPSLQKESLLKTPKSNSMSGYNHLYDVLDTNYSDEVSDISSDEGYFVAKGVGEFVEHGFEPIARSKLF